MKKETEVSIEKYNKLQKDIDEFMYIFSHDFNAPLRHIREFTNLLIKKSADKLGPDEQKYAEIIEKSVKSTESMLEGLLQLSRLNTQAEDFSEVDCSELIKGIETSATVELTHSSLPIVTGDKKQLSIVFNKLINNSVKFRKPDSNLKIHITHSEIDDYHQFTIQDTGIGIEPGFEEIIFTLFRKLQTNDDYPGSGVGLTVCKKIIERHGGKIWVTPSKNDGAIFNFTTSK